MRSVRRGERAQSSGFIVFFLILAISALLFGLADPAVDQSTDMALNDTTNQTAEDAIDRRQTIWNNILYVPVLLGLVFLLSRAVIQSRGP